MQRMNYHGHFTLWRENQLIVAKVYGAWSMDTAQDYATQLKDLALSMNGQPWARVVFLDQWQLGTPDFEKVMKDLMSWCVSHQLKYTAYVFQPSHLREHQLDKVINQASDTSQKKMFTHQQDALDWLNSVGFALPSLSNSKC